MKKLFGKNNGEEHNFWMSYTDLLSGFLIVFIIATIIYQHEQNKIYSVVKEKGYNNVEDVVKMVNKYENEKNLKNINDKFKQLFDSLKVENVEFDTIEGSIRFYPARGHVLFRPDADRMEPNLKDRIKLIGKPFVQEAIKIAKKYPSMEIRIEGHTDTTDTFMYNLDLSSRRAYSVYECIHDECELNDNELEFVEKQMISVGYSYAKPLDINGKLVPFNSDNVDMGTSRRIEFRIISK